MSAFVCTSKHIGTMVNGIKALLEKHGHNSGGRETQIGETVYEARLPQYPRLMAPEKLLREDLLAMNVNAVAARYGVKNNVPFNHNVTCTHVMPDVFLYKLLRCFLYQCSEGTIDQLQLYQELERFGQFIADDIVSALPEYGNSPWGIN